MTQTFQTLVSAVKAASEVDDSDFDSFIKNTAFNLVEERLTRDLDAFGLMISTQVSTSGGDAFVTKPSGTRVVKSLMHVSDGERQPLFLRTDEFCQDYWPVRASTGTPKFYANWNGSTLILAPTPSVSGTLELSVVVRPSALTSTTQETNWFTEFAPNALYYGIMVEAARFTKNWSIVPMWEQAYQGEIEVLRNEARRTRRDDQSSPESPQAENTLSGR